MPEKIKDIYEAFSLVNDYAEMKKLFSEIFTQAEEKDIVLRWELLRQLADGKPQREIAKGLRISLCKITRGAKILKDDGSELRKLIDR
jgi:TrpR family transcriptional regulator, trp operon repressor